MNFVKKPLGFLLPKRKTNENSSNGLLHKFKHLISTIYHKADNFIKILDGHNIFMLSAGIAFNIFLYFIPLMLIAIYIAINLVDTATVDNTIQTLFLEFLPDTENTFIIIYEVLNEISTIQRGSSTSGLIGLVSLLWISSLFISSIRSGLDRVMELQGKRVFIFYRLKDILLTLFFPVLIIFYSLSIPLITIFLNYFTGIFPFLKSDILQNWTSEGFSFIFSLILFYLMYKFIPSMKVKMQYAFTSALIGGLMVMLARWIFSWYLVSLSNYGTFYGTYAAIVSIAIWVYYFSFILLFSAEISNLIYKKKTI